MSCDDFPFDLYYVELYDRMKQVRTVVRRCLADYTLEDEYRCALLEIERILAEVVNDARIKSLVKRLKDYYRDFQKLRQALESQGSRAEVEARVKRYMNLFNPFFADLGIL